ncbi:PREDICTED: protein PLASTID MOVEMENT IMPAIRED 1-RELATED 1-like [Lupinus angustifolius]|uniref:protein PLASTID MOVEMENT IMPAIRED 1-RELATED 1-like n=1 Tax=Lupinus angustifolius TaxID=3871 RepID=UPI00092F8D82|nr:PREDICTED: protein PLASTID MOVEMENT IMPAIRED 1-RELATED 1-like [Lupinus angustifolius]
MSNFDVGKNSSEGSDNQNKLLKDVQTISEVVYLDKSSLKKATSAVISRSKSTDKFPVPDPKSKPKANKEDKLDKDKKSIWNWKPLKALNINRSQKFNCCFSLQVHLIEGLPSTFNDANLCVYWKRRDEVMMTPPAKVIQCTAEFEERLTYTCSISGSKSGPHGSAKYEAKHVLLYASMVGAPELDLGKHRVDLSRLLPLTLKELEEEKSSGKWTTSFRLSGAATGAAMNVSFGYVVVSDNTSATRDNHIAPGTLTLRQNSLASLMKPDQSDRSVRRTGSLPSIINQYSCQNIDVVKDLHEVLPLSKSELAISIDTLYKKIEEKNTFSPLKNEPELDVFTKTLEMIKPDACISSETGKEKPKEHPVKDGKTCNPVHGKPEFVVFQENMETVKPDDYPSPDSGNENCEKCEGDGFFVVDQGIELSSNEHVKREEPVTKALADAHTVDRISTIDAAAIQVSFEDSYNNDSLYEVDDSSKEKTVVHEFSYEEGTICTTELLLQELESALNSVSDLESVALDSPDIMEAKSEYKMRKSHSLDDVTESVASEFLSMLGIDHNPMSSSSESETESPRERLLRQFEKDTLSEGFSLFNFEMGNDNEADDNYDDSFGFEQWEFSDSINSSSMLEDLKEEHLIESRDVKSKMKPHMLEDMETEALMRQWGFNENAFQHSPPKDITGFGSPIHLPPEESHVLPPLAEGLGPFLQTKDGGFLRSMNPALFRNGKCGGNLIMQVSNPVVVPAEMGSGIMEILQCLASVGIEKLSMQAKKLMPLEDITGKNMQQIAWESMPVSQGTERQCHLQHDLVTVQDATCVQRDSKGTSSGLKSIKFSPSSVGNQTGKEFVSLDDLAPLAMDKIEALSVEGLRIQSGMSEEDAPSNIITQSFGEISAIQGKGVTTSGSLDLDGAAALQLLDLKYHSDGDDGIIGLSLTLDEWMRLDSGEIDDDIDNISEHTSKVLAAHHANNSFELICSSSKGERKRGKGTARKCGLLGNNFTAALMVQLRDPMRNYEPVGTPMLALIQVERVFFPPKQKISRSVSEVGNNDNVGDECEIVAKVEMKQSKKEEKNSEEEGIPQFRITEVHVAGLKNEPYKKKLWGTSNQQQSGSRWLLANGMGKSNKHPLMKSKAVSKSTNSAPVTTKVQPGDTLWSISSRIYGTGTKWKELVALNPHIRNPNIIIPNETIRVG